MISDAVRHDTPWQVDPDEAGLWLVNNKKGVALFWVHDENQANHIVSCVNAIGDRDPVAVAKALEFLEHHKEEAVKFFDCDDQGCEFCNSRDTLTRIVDALHPAAGGQP